MVSTVRGDPSVHLMVPPRVFEIDCQTDPRWAALVARMPDALIYHHPAWLRLLETAFGYRPAHLACEDADGRLRGIFPLLRQHGLITGSRLSSLPRTPIGGPLAEDDQTRLLLIQAAIERTRAEPGAYLQIKMRSPALGGLSVGLVGVPWRESYRLRLPERLEQLQFGTPRKHARVKWGVNKAMSLGVRVREADSHRDLRLWYGMFLETMREFCVPPRPLRFFELAWEELRPRGMLRLLLAERMVAGHTQPMAGTLFVMYGQTVFGLFNGRRRAELALHPNDLIQWQAIHDACAAGFRAYDLGEVTSTHPQLAQFKRKWGARPEWLYRYYYPWSREVEISVIESRSRAGQVARALWQHLPLPATALLGDWAHRYF